MKNLSHTALAASMVLFTLSTISTHGCELNAHFDYSISNHTVWFNDLSSASEGTFITSWYWEFGDGATGTQQFPVHVFPGSGTFPVCLTVIATEGNAECQHTWCADVEIEEESLCYITAGFSHTLLENGEVQFIQQSYGNVFTDVVSYSWSMGDGLQDTSFAPAHTYSEPQNVQVCLTATGEAYGNICSALHCHEIEVNNFPCGLEVDFTSEDLGNCVFEFSPQVQAGAWTTINSITWTADDEDFGEYKPQYVFGEAGLHEVCLAVTATAPEGSCSQEVCEEIETSCVLQQPDGIEETFSSPIKIYPNPASDVVKIELSFNCTVIISDLRGVELLNEKGTQMDLSALSAGNYLLTVMDEFDRHSTTLLTKVD